MSQLGHGHWTLALWQSCFYTGAMTKCSGPAAVSALGQQCSECCRGPLAQALPAQDLRVCDWIQELPCHLQDERTLLILVLIHVLPFCASMSTDQSSGMPRHFATWMHFTADTTSKEECKSVFSLPDW